MAPSRKSELETSSCAQKSPQRCRFLTHKADVCHKQTFLLLLLEVGEGSSGACTGLPHAQSVYGGAGSGAAISHHLCSLPAAEVVMPTA